MLALLVSGCMWMTMDFMEQPRREAYVNNHPELSTRMEALILNGSITIGMTEEQARVSWGSPDHINRSVGSWGVHEQWVYGRYSHNYLYFENGILTSWQN